MRDAAACRLRRISVVATAAFVSGCGFEAAPILDPKGPIALAERDLIFTAMAIMLIVILPVFVFAFWFVWRYRASNANARYEPEWFSPKIDAIVWIVPALIIVTLGILVWINTHKLDPYRPLASSQPALEVDVIAQDWKWLFVYPEQRIAVVNELAFPSGRPLSLRITSDTVMNSFFVPALGGQIYAMAGMQTRLNLLADEPGRFAGRNTQYSGDGFSRQYFEAVAMTADDFDNWVANVRRSPNALNEQAYEALAKPSEEHPVTYYSGVEPNLFNSVIAKYCRHLCRADGGEAK